MIISIWRYSHLLLAVSSFIFISIASITGVILAVEPISNKLEKYDVDGASELSLSETIPQLKNSYDEIFSLEVGANGFVALSAIDQKGNMGNFYINPFTGEKEGDLIKKSSLFEFATNLHRSLFLKAIGRFFIGLTSFLLFLITITGAILILKRQQGIKHFLSKIVKDNFFQYYHVYLGRLVLIPIIIISITGTYLSLQRFAIIPEGKISHNIDFGNRSDSPKINLEDFPIFKNTQLSDIRSLEFPFSPDEEDYFTLQLKTKELLVDQYTGEVLSEINSPLVKVLSDLSISLHTGRGSIGWSIILGLSSFSTLFFIYSGFSLTLKRRNYKLKNTFGKDECDYIILVGSETGSTLPYAIQLHEQLLKAEKKAFITELNRYTRFKQMEHLVVITSTYGQGEAPENARKFLQIFRETRPKTAYSFSVVGFGSLAYIEFCKFAFDIDHFLQKDANSHRLLETHTINNRSWESYRQWVKQWSEELELSLELPANNPVEVKKKEKQLFKVVKKTQAAENPDETFLLQVESSQKQRFQSGDLLAIYPAPNAYERLYSMAVLQNNQVLLSIKRHEKGLCSNYLNELNFGETLEANIVKNQEFYFPKKAKRVVMIGTGTGIAPFLGMLDKNNRQVETHLYWGARNQQSFELYKNYIETALNDNRLTNFIPAYSRLGTSKTYVQELISRDSQWIAQTLREKGVIMICGSIAMQKEVIAHLEKICLIINQKSLSYYQNRNQLRMDCY
ncbi:PepSY domain-containing protein [Flammeovirgaceae bacterium SG7u.111]|nr:PepSY domain-containing protein [Flammeovirgaceae bacterium SG7u.132]WPO37197.1 PepSY domain-containing protein [Flammeovirgaceae bacterium SG7u.111]